MDVGILEKFFGYLYTGEYEDGLRLECNLMCPPSASELMGPCDRLSRMPGVSIWADNKPYFRTGQELLRRWVPGCLRRLGPSRCLMVSGPKGELQDCRDSCIPALNQSLETALDMLTAANYFCADELAVEATERLCFAAEALSLHCCCQSRAPPADNLDLCPLDACTCGIGEICNDVLVELSESPQHGGLAEWTRTFSAALGRGIETVAEPQGASSSPQYTGVPYQQGWAQPQAQERLARNQQSQFGNSTTEAIGGQQQQQQQIICVYPSPVSESRVPYF
ncbi:hypothetical protein PG994_010222 [Apiospora phragmitis]|uniref:Uncharacterized protein n=1 Tax=Apiospora phragmitis TaxID=2905665 RepID=A0ABR1TPI2_9PEZI